LVETQSIVKFQTFLFKRLIKVHFRLKLLRLILTFLCIRPEVN